MQIIKERMYSISLELEMRYDIFLPDGYERGTDTYPVLYLHDGQEVFCDEDSTNGESLQFAKYYGEHGSELPAVILVAVECPEDRGERTALYTPYTKDFEVGGKMFEPHIEGRGKEYLFWIVNDLKPHIDRNYRTKKEREYTAIGGFSTGGVLSTFAILKYPEVFSRLLLMSAAFYIWFDRLKETFQESRMKETGYIYMDVGTEEYGRMTTKEEFLQGNYEVSRQMLLSGLLEEHLFFRICAGQTHSFCHWRKRFPQALCWIFKDRLQDSDFTKKGE